MRLTLRTLLAWLDDTLPPSQVREIGKQVSESQYAQDLVERIHRVCRQRRLTVPSKSGTEWTDPNLVAGYVDNDLDPDQVTEYEKKCLSSDVNLAEAACVHQILSLLGQKVHVPAESKARMAQLVKGRESIPNGSTERVKPVAPSQVTKPIQPWVAPEPLPRPWLERFGPALVCLGLIGLLSWSAYQSLTPTDQGSDAGVPTANTTTPQLIRKGEVLAKNTEPAATPDAKGEKPATEPEPKADSSTASVASAEPAKEDSQPGTAKPDSQPAAVKDVPTGALGVVDHTSGVLLRLNSESREWESIADGTSLASGDQLICLAPFQSRIVIGTTTVRLLGETRLRVLSKTPTEAAAFELPFGRVIVEGPMTKAPVRVDYSGQSLFLERLSDDHVGLEHVETWSYGKPAVQQAPLGIHLAGGDLNLSLGQARKSVAGPCTLFTNSAGQITDSPGKTVPDWVSATEPSEKEQKLGEQFATQFSRGGHVLADIVSATENESPVTKKYAILAVKALGDLSFLTPILSREKDPSARQSAIAALRQYLVQDPEAKQRIREPLAEEFGERDGRTIEALLAGYPPTQASKRETLSQLVSLLSPDEHSLAIRELALDNLKTITGKTVEDYDPENPTEKAFAEWKALLSKGDLKAAAPTGGTE